MFDHEQENMKKYVAEKVASQKAQEMAQQMGQGVDYARPMRDRTAREALTKRAEEATRAAAAIYEKIESFDKTYGKNFLEISEREFTRRFSLDIWSPF